MPTDTLTKPKLSLAEIKAKHELLFASFFDGVMEQVQFTPEAGQQIADCLKGTIEKRDELVDVLYAVEDEAERLKAMEKRITERRRQYENFCTSLRDVIRFQMDNLGIRRVDGLVHRLLLREGKDKVEVTDIALLPPDFINYEPTADKSAISKALHEGREVPGAVLIPAKSSLVVT